MDFVKKNAKAVATFVLTVLLQAVTDVINGTAGVDIFDWKSVARYIGLSLVAAAAVWATGNKLDLSQILAGVRKLNVPQQQQVAQETLTELPDHTSDKVVASYPDWTTT